MKSIIKSHFGDKLKIVIHLSIIKIMTIIIIRIIAHQKCNSNEHRITDINPLNFFTVSIIKNDSIYL